MKTIKVRITFTEGLLGTLPNDEDIYRKFILDRAKSNGAEITDSKEEEELEALEADELVEKGMTVFPRTADGKPFLYDYQIKGFFKDACAMLKKVSGTESSGIKAYKKEIDGLIFPMPRKIVIDGELTTCQRPLRAQTMQGERTTLAMSDEIKEGATIEFEIITLKDSLIAAIREWLDYGRLRGIGQWRNSGKGRFTWEELT